MILDVITKGEVSIFIVLFSLCFFCLGAYSVIYFDNKLDEYVKLHSKNKKK